MSVVYLPLTRGQTAVIDAADAHLVMKHKWRAIPRRHGMDGWYAVTGNSRHGTQVLLHRLLLDVGADALVDHRDGDGLNCRRNNLREATSAQNSANSNRALPESGFRGVHRKGSGWRAQVGGIGYKRGPVRPSAIDAAHDYDRLAVERFGDFARLNFPESAAA